MMKAYRRSLVVMLPALLLTQFSFVCGVRPAEAGLHGLAQSPQALLDRAVADFEAGRFAESAATFSLADTAPLTAHP
jgi:hypothetical protein